MSAIVLPLSGPQILARLELLEAAQIAAQAPVVPAITAPPAVRVNGSATVAQFGAIIPRSPRRPTAFDY